MSLTNWSGSISTESTTPMSARPPASSNHMTPNRPGGHRGAREQQRDDDGRQRLHRHQLPDSEGGDQSRQQDTSGQQLGVGGGVPSGRLNNAVTVYQRHSWPSRELRNRRQNEIVLESTTCPDIQIG